MAKDSGSGSLQIMKSQNKNHVFIFGPKFVGKPKNDAVMSRLKPLSLSCHV